MKNIAAALFLVALISFMTPSGAWAENGESPDAQSSTAGLSDGGVRLIAAAGAATARRTTLPNKAKLAPETAPATPPAAMPNEPWRKKPPVTPPPRPFKLPAVTNFKLDNGLSVQLVEDHRVPFITVGLGMKAGSTLDPNDKLGLASLTADMLSEGTASKKSKEIADEVDFIGGGLKAVTDYDYTILSASGLSKYNDRLLDIMSDVLLHPTFPEDELALKKTNLIEELKIKRTQPDFLVEERFNKVVFGQHPYSVVAPTPETVNRISRQDLVQFHDQNYVPNGSIFVAVGDFDAAKMKQALTDRFAANFKPGTIASVQLPEIPKAHGRRIYLVDRPGSVQSSIRIGNAGIKRSDPDYFAAQVMNQILGGGAQSRLFLNIREQKGYTYGAYSDVSARRDGGVMDAEAEVRSDVTNPSLEEFLYELDRIRNTKASDKELKDAKSYMIGSFQLGLETQAGLLKRLLEVKLYDLPDNYLETYAGKVMAVKADDVRLAARKLIDNGNLIIAIVGDAAKIKPDLLFFAPVDVYDTSGKLSSESDKNPAPGS